MAVAKLALEDGRVWTGRCFGAIGQTDGEVVFNTSMTGYQEILTDPSYRGQIVCMTYPLIGNYGINEEDVESERPHLAGFVLREASRVRSNFRSTGDLGDYLAEHDIVGIEGIDTRSLVRHIRTQGAMRGVISSSELDDAKLVEAARTSPGLVGRDLVREVVAAEARPWEEKLSPWTRLCPTERSTCGDLPHVVALDFGMKWNIARHLADQGCRVTILPGTTPAEEILALNPDGLFLSNGPGDPEPLTYAIETVRQIVGENVPTFGICLGHQILGLACGAKTYKLKFGHRGANQPVLNVETGKVEITSQNHGFAIDESTMPGDLVVTHRHLNDNTVAGLKHRDRPAFSVQYHPEASAGPHDSSYLFDQFRAMLVGDASAASV